MKKIKQYFVCVYINKATLLGYILLFVFIILCKYAPAGSIVSKGEYPEGNFATVLLVEICLSLLMLFY